MQNNAENKRPYKTDIYQEFLTWSALPPMERWRVGIKDQSDFAQKYGVNKDTLTRWKNRPDFEQRVDKLQKSWGREKTADIIQAIYVSAMKGKAKSQKLFLDYFTDFRPPKPGDKPPKPIVEMTENDIRQVILEMPKWRQDKHFNAIRDIIDDSVFFRDRPDTTEEEYNEINKDGL